MPNIVYTLMESEMLPAEAVNADWRKSKSCTNGSCVEVANVNGLVAVRDSKNPDGAILLYSRDEWHAFLGGAKNGDFDDLVS